MKKMIPFVDVVVGYSCPDCNISGIKRKDESCSKCGTLFNWSPYKKGSLLSAKRVKDVLLNTTFEKLNMVYAGRVKYNNKLSLSIHK